MNESSKAVAVTAEQGQAAPLSMADARRGAEISLHKPKAMPPEIPVCPFAAGDKVRTARACESLGGHDVAGGVLGVVESVRPDGVPLVDFGDGKFSVRSMFLEAAP